MASQVVAKELKKNISNSFQLRQSPPQKKSILDTINVIYPMGVNFTGNDSSVCTSTVRSYVA